MSNPYIGEIRMFGGNFPPNGWAICDGSLMQISQNDVLFQLIGTTYGGDGVNTFGLPNLLGRVPVHNGTNPQTGTTFVIGQLSGTESVTLTPNQIPAHTHTLAANAGGANAANPAGMFIAGGASGPSWFATSGAVPLAPNALAPAGSSQPHDNMVPFLAINFIISLFGIFPSQN
jgi:microcystin-dependent protein